MNLGPSSYDILVERGALAKAGEHLNLNRKVFILTDSGVPKEYAKAVEEQSHEGFVYTIKQGEGSKSIATLNKVLEKIEIITKQQIDNEDIRYIQSKQTDEKIFNYRANIISLYGVFEFFIEEVFKEYVECLKNIIPQYDSLNDKIKKNYFTNTAKLHSKLHYAKFSHIKERDIAQNIENVN